MSMAIISFILSFLLTLFLIPFWIKKAKAIGLVGNDIHKKDKRVIPESGGVIVIFSSLIGIFAYIFMNTFIIKVDIHLIEILAITITFILAGFIGFIDDILGWRKGLKQFHKFLISIPIAIPLMALNAGTSYMIIPIFGKVDFGLIYPLFIVPIAIIFATNSFNMLAGLNGLEAGNGIIILLTLGFLVWRNGDFWASVIALIVASSLLGFIMFNKYPSKIFPGDSLTYFIGAVIASIAIAGNAEKAVSILLIPYLFEFLLKARGKFKKTSFLKLKKDGSLEIPDNKFYSLTYLSLWLLKRITHNKKVYEKNVVYLLWFAEIILAIIVILM